MESWLPLPEENVRLVLSAVYWLAGTALAGAVFGGSGRAVVLERANIDLSIAQVVPLIDQGRAGAGAGIDGGLPLAARASW
jgi:hypothetical protein